MFLKIFDSYRELPRPNEDNGWSITNDQGILARIMGLSIYSVLCRRVDGRL